MFQAKGKQEEMGKAFTCLGLARTSVWLDPGQPEEETLERRGKITQGLKP